MSSTGPIVGQHCAHVSSAVRGQSGELPGSLLGSCARLLPEGSAGGVIEGNHTSQEAQGIECRDRLATSRRQRPASTGLRGCWLKTHCNLHRALGGLPASAVRKRQSLHRSFGNCLSERRETCAVPDVALARGALAVTRGPTAKTRAMQPASGFGESEGRPLLGAWAFRACTHHPASPQLRAFSQESKEGCRQSQSSTGGCSNERVAPSLGECLGTTHRHSGHWVVGPGPVPVWSTHLRRKLSSSTERRRDVRLDGNRRNKQQWNSARARGRHMGDPRCGQEARPGVSALDEQSEPTRSRSDNKADLVSADTSKPAEANPHTCVPPLMNLCRHTPSTGNRQMRHRVT